MNIKTFPGVVHRLADQWLGSFDILNELHIDFRQIAKGEDGDSFLESYSYLLPVKGFHQQFEIIHLSGDILFDTF